MDSDFCRACVEWLLNYGGVILFFALALGIIALPIPDDTLLLVAGMLIEKGDLDPLSTFLFGVFGSMLGITVSYFLGREAGPWVVKKFGSKLRLTEARLEKVNNWFNKIGKWTLLICYFLPVIRHVAGFVAGSSRLKLHQFMIFAYSGAIFWVASYLAVGYYLKKMAANGVKLLFIP